MPVAVHHEEERHPDCPKIEVRKLYKGNCGRAEMTVGLEIITVAFLKKIKDAGF